MPPEPSDQRPPKGDRIAKLLARAGVASRREIERMIAEGRIARDGETIDTPATILSSLHGVTVDGRPVAAPPPARLFLYHKPAGLLVTERDPAGRPTIYDRLPADLPRVLPVGRLDLNTEGLLLLTTDGGLKRALELPATGVERAYRARAYGAVTQAQLEELIEGVEIDGIRYGKIDANLERRTGANVWIEMILTEGKNREVRRVLEHLGLQVGRLIRTRYGPFVLGDLQPGEVGEVRQHDLIVFRKSLTGKRPDSGDRIAVDARVAAALKEEPVAEPAPEPRRPRPAAPKRAEKPSGGWGSRARPSRPRAAETPAPDASGDAAAPWGGPTGRGPARARTERTGEPAGSGARSARPVRGDDRSRSGPGRTPRDGDAPTRTIRRDGRAGGPERRTPDAAGGQRGDDRHRTDDGSRSRPPRGARADGTGRDAARPSRADRPLRATTRDGETGRRFRDDGDRPRTAGGDRASSERSAHRTGRDERTARPSRSDRPLRPSRDEGDRPRAPRGGAAPDRPARPPRKDGGGDRPRPGGNGDKPRPGGARPPRGRR